MPVKDWLPAALRAAAFDRKLKAGEALFRLGDKATGLCEVVSGRVRLARVDRSGHEIVLHVAGPGGTLAEASLFSASYHCDAIASTNATVRVYPKREMLAASARERVRHYLVLNAGADGRTVELGGTLKDMAAELGLTHEVLYRTLAALERSGEIKRSRGKITRVRPNRV
jgi:CRP-like cAMP-binding protein